MLGEVRLARERFLPSVDEIDDRSVHVGTENTMTLERALDRQRQADLAERNNTDVHRFPHR